MKLKTPSFWYRDIDAAQGVGEKIMAPLSWLYRLGYELHQHSKQSEKLDIPVICIGNINTGGTGKTPTALALMDLIREHNLAARPHFLLRGYGGGERGPLLVEPDKHTSWHTGDEALILASKAPTIVSVDRVQGALLAARKNADLVLMDDGLQNPGIHKDIKIVVINGEMGFGNGRLLPAGPLREPLGKGLARADIFILIGEDVRGAEKLLPPGKPVIHAHLEPDNTNLPPQGKKYLAFAGLGYPEKFFAFLRETINLDVVKTISFPDHYPYNEKDLARLRDMAAAYEAELITTRKDYLRLPSTEGSVVYTASVRLAWDNESVLIDYLKSRLSERGA